MGTFIFSVHFSQVHPVPSLEADLEKTKVAGTLGVPQGATLRRKGLSSEPTRRRNGAHTVQSGHCVASGLGDGRLCAAITLHSVWVNGRLLSGMSRLAKCLMGRRELA
jgi:hypothetical protein